ncbi:hypothetical protein FDK38_000396 [Candidozyma auris]|nr:hypothetical protein FDK38_000396 [[Candida] auris]
MLIQANVFRFLSRSPRSLRSASTYAVNDGSHLGDSLATEGIETVPLAFDKHEPSTNASDKSPLMFLHGLFGSKTNTRTVAKTLASRLSRDVYCLDLRNFGQSPHIERLDYPSMAADVERFIEEAKIPKKPILVGHSMGAKTVMALALRRPDLPGMIVSVDNAPVFIPSTSGGKFGKYIKQLRYALEGKKYTNIKDVDAELAKIEPSKEIRQFLLTNVDRGQRDDVCKSRIPLDIIDKAVTAGNIASWPYDPNVARWTKGPALFIRGTESTYVPDDVFQDIGQYFPHFEVRDVKAGHWLISENPKEFMDILCEFIERNEDI